MVGGDTTDEETKNEFRRPMMPIIGAAKEGASDG